DLNEAGEPFGSETEVRFRCSRPEAAGTFIECGAVNVAAAELNGSALPGSAFAGGRIQLPGLAAENLLRVKAEMPYSHVGRGLHFFRDPEDGRAYLHSQFESYDAHQVFACFDQPDLKADYDLT